MLCSLNAWSNRAADLALRVVVQVGLQVLLDDGRVFHCHNTRWNTIYYRYRIAVSQSHPMVCLDRRPCGLCQLGTTKCHVRCACPAFRAVATHVSAVKLWLYDVMPQ